MESPLFGVVRRTSQKNNQLEKKKKKKTLARCVELWKRGAPLLLLSRGPTFILIVLRLGNDEKKCHYFKIDHFFYLFRFIESKIT